MSSEVATALVAAGAVLMGSIIGFVGNYVLDFGRTKRAVEAERATDLRDALYAVQGHLEEVFTSPRKVGDWWPLIYARLVRVDDLELQIILSDFHVASQQQPPVRNVIDQRVVYHWSEEAIEAFTNAHERIGNLLHGVPRHSLKRKPTERPVATGRDGEPA
jgi:hypothetical protein